MSAQTLNIPADGSHAQATLGRYQFFFVRFLSKPAEISFDGAQWQPVAQNDRFTRSEIPTRVFFRSTSGLASLVTFQYSMTPFSAQDTAITPAATAAQGNLGIPDDTAATGGLPECNAEGQLLITDDMQLPIAGSLDGNLRQKIIFYAAAGAQLKVKDENLCQFTTLRVGEKIVFDTAANFVISGAGATSYVIIGQIFNA